MTKTSKICHSEEIQENAIFFQKLHRAAMKLSNSAYEEGASSKEILRAAIIEFQKLRDEYNE